MATLSEILKSKIGKGGKSKAYVADILGVSEKTIENYMNGIRQPKPEALVKLAETLGFSLSELSEQTVPTNGHTKPVTLEGSQLEYVRDLLQTKAMAVTLVQEVAALKAHLHGGTAAEAVAQL